MEQNNKTEQKVIHPVDKFVGQKIRQRRWVIGMTQQELANAVGIKFQQIQKYETGTNRVSASRLWDIGRTLNVPVGYFFEGLQDEEASEQDVFESEAIMDKETSNLIRFYRQIPEKQRRKLFEMAQTLSAE